MFVLVGQYGQLTVPRWMVATLCQHDNRNNEHHLHREVIDGRKLRIDLVHSSIS